MRTDEKVIKEISVGNVNIPISAKYIGDYEIDDIKDMIDRGVVSNISDFSFYDDGTDATTVNLQLKSGQDKRTGLYFDTVNLATGETGEGNAAGGDISIAAATTSKAGVMTAADKTKLDSLFGMSISGTVNLTTGTFNTTNNTSLNSYSAVFKNMQVGEMRMYLVSDSNGNLPTSETYVTVPYSGITSPAQIYFGKSPAFGASVGDICVLFKRSSLLNICRIIPLNDVKSANGSFPGADGLSTVWDKERINKIDGIEWTANHVRDNYLPKNDRFPSRADWLINVDYCIDNGVYPTCDSQSLNLGLVNNYVTVVVQRTSTADNGGYHTIEQTAYGRGSDEGQIYKRIIFVKSDDSDVQYGEWLCITKQLVNIKVRVSDTYTFTDVFQTIAEYLMNTTEAEKGEVTVRHAAASVTLGNFTFTCINSGSYTLKGFIDPIFSKNNDTNCTGVIEYGEIFLRLSIGSGGHVYGKGESLVNGDTWTWEKSYVGSTIKAKNLFRSLCVVWDNGNMILDNEPNNIYYVRSKEGLQEYDSIEGTNLQTYFTVGTYINWNDYIDIIGVGNPNEFGEDFIKTTSNADLIILFDRGSSVWGDYNNEPIILPHPQDYTGKTIQVDHSKTRGNNSAIIGCVESNMFINNFEYSEDGFNYTTTLDTATINASSITQFYSIGNKWLILHYN